MKDKLNFFRSGMFVKGKIPIFLIISCLLFVLAFSAFSVALTTSVTDTELSVFRRCYEYDEEYITVRPSTVTLDNKHGFTYNSALNFTDEQLDALKKYAGESLTLTRSEEYYPCKATLNSAAACPKISGLSTI